MSAATSNYDALDLWFNSEPADWDLPQYAEAKELSEIGPINSIRLPLTWEQGISHYYRLGMSACQEHHPPGDEEVRLIFFYRGVPYEPEIGETFSRILNRPPHSLDAAEYEQVKPLLRGKENTAEFELLGIHTESLNSRQVLVLTGIYSEDQKPMLSIYIDAGHDGTVVQEIEYQAPLLKYADYLPEVQQILQSICWK